MIHRSNQRSHLLIIPKKFKLAGMDVDVVNNNTLCDNHKAVGHAIYAEGKIEVDIDSVSAQVAEQSFLHELVHWILYMMGNDELRNNEQFVDLFAHFLYQYEQTKEGSL